MNYKTVLFIFFLAFHSLSFGDAFFDRNIFYQLNSDVERRSYITSSSQTMSYEALYAELARPVAFKPIASKRLKKVEQNLVNGEKYFYTIKLPSDFKATQNYPVIIFLHGGIERPGWRENGRWWPDYNSVDTPDYIQVFPAAWNKARWWQNSQIENIESIIKKITSTYPIDTNQVYLTGISDGASGAFYWGGKIPDRFAAVAPVIGNPSVLSEKKNQVEDDTYLINFRLLPWMVVNSTQDHLYSVKTVRPMMNHIKKLGVNLNFIEAEGKHSYRVFNSHYSSILEFFKQHKRKPHPDYLVWQTDLKSNFNRVYWVSIDEISKQVPKVPLFSGLFNEDSPGGLIEARVDNNRIDLSAYSVEKLTFYISPQQFTLDQPISIIINGKEYFQGKVKPDKQVLIDEFMKHQDPKRLYAAKITLTLN